MTDEQAGAGATMPDALKAILSEPGWVCGDNFDYCTREFGGIWGITVEPIRGRRCAYVEDGDGNVIPTHTIRQIAVLLDRIEQALAAEEEAQPKPTRPTTKAYAND